MVNMWSGGAYHPRAIVQRSKEASHILRRIVKL
jgi:hypothetical protein